MSKELRDKAERLVQSIDMTNALIPPNLRGGDAMTDAAEVCRAYLAEHPADDEEPVSKEYVRSLGKMWRDDKDCVIVFLKESTYLNAQALWESDWSKKKWRCCIRIYSGRIENAALVEAPTRGDVRRLCKALGIELIG